jgi:hypothetical protein
MQETKGRMLTPAEVAEIWNERAREMGYPDTHYTRFSVRQRHRKGKEGLAPALQTPMGYLYWEEDVKEIRLYPKKSRKQLDDANPLSKGSSPADN